MEPHAQHGDDGPTKAAPTGRPWDQSPSPATPQPTAPAGAVDATSFLWTTQPPPTPPHAAPGTATPVPPAAATAAATTAVPGTTPSAEVATPEAADTAPPTEESTATSPWTAVTAEAEQSSPSPPWTASPGGMPGVEDFPGSTVAPGNATDCSEAPCRNGATCEDTPAGVRCLCAFGWSGPRCADGVRVTSAAFAGHSYLVHRLPGTLGGVLGSQVAVRARTLAPSGLLLHAALAPELYMTLYLEDGLLKFQFSCGVQTMVFSEVQHRVNNGFELHIAASLVVLPLRGAMRPCSAALHVNHSLAMSGEQQSVEPQGGGVEHRANRSALLYLGGLPSHDHPLHPEHHDDAPIPGGLVGCMMALEVDDAPRRVFEDADGGAEVSECAALACLSAPCQAGGTCVQDGQDWNCLCPSGYVGRTCETSVCRNNPCKFGGTCVPFPASGFLCLCPMGKHGLFCESDLEIAQPSFSPSVAGLSSFAAYALPVAVEDAMELRFRFVPATQDQVGLMLFLGQDGPHDATSDHLAVSFIKGYVVLTWNLGSGPRRIFTPRPLEPRGRRPHSVRVGRAGHSAWLVADGMGNVTGSSPGPLSQLNTAPWLYLGGHDVANFSGLPHDLPLHSGFAGCLLDVEVLAGTGSSRVTVSLERTRAAAGRAVGQCGTTLCHARACQHRAACLHHAASFSCLCSDGWFGPTCAQRFNPCDATRHNCSAGATCVPLRDGYECDCPFGRTGRFCEREEAVSDVLLTGRRSFLSLGAVDLQRAQSCVAVDVRPLADDGVLLHAGHAAPRAPALALVLRGGLLEARLSSGTPSRRWGVVTVRSRRVLAREDWHRVRVCRYGRRLFLWVDGAAHSAALRPSQRLPAVGAPLYIGGAPDLSALPSLGGVGMAVPLRACVRGVSVNWRHTPLDAAHVLEARNVEDCDGTACGGDVCQHGGSCWLSDGGDAYCTCASGYSGRHCERQLACDASRASKGLAMPCRNRGRCVAERCHCPAGWGGAFCEEEVALGTPHFAGEGYLMVDADAGRSGNAHGDLDEFGGAVGAVGGRMRARRDLSFLYLNFSTTHDNGMMLWSAEDDELVGVGVEAGRLKVVWGWRGAGVFVALLPGPAVSDGAWHDLALSFGANVTVWTDGSQEPLQRLAAEPRPISSGGVFYVAGFPGNKSVVMETKGVFNVPFSGCIQQVSWNQDSSVTDFAGYEGENVGTCELFQP